LRSSVLDSYAVLVFLFKQKGHEKVLSLLEKAAEADEQVLVAAPNWAEVRYMVQRKSGASTWNETRTKLLGLPIEVVPVDQDLAEIAGEFKASRKMSLADCFAAALAKDRNADVYTGDPEFRGVEKEVKIVWV